MSRKPDAVETAAHDLPDDFLLCRDMGHAWTPYRLATLVGGFEQTLRCLRCEAERTRVLTRFASIERSRMHYPEGYLLHGVGHSTREHREVFRLEGITRMYEVKRPRLRRVV